MNHLHRRESGQALILFALMASALFGMLTLALYGSKLYVQYRQMQHAADIAALVGAEDLPCASTDTGCISAAESDACTYAGVNYTLLQSACNSGYSAGSQNWAAVPPNTCSPYDFIDYGNALTDTSCQHSGLTYVTSTQYFYIEVHLTMQVQVPWIAVSFPISVHAVARRGIGTGKDFALAILDLHQAGALAMSGQQSGGMVLDGQAISNSDSTSSITTGGQATNISCDGGWYAVGSIADASNPLSAQAGATTNFSPPQCNAGVVDSTPDHPGTTPIADPYAAGSPPPTVDSNGNPAKGVGLVGMTNCAACNDNGWYFTWTDGNARSTGTLQQATNGSDLSINNSKTDVEFFPGVYPRGMKIASASHVYFNPGVYTMEQTSNQDLTFSGGSVCIYGAPACDAAIAHATGAQSTVTCSNDNFNTTSDGGAGDGSGSVWYYYCSPFGIWDSWMVGGSGPGAGNPTAVSDLTTAPAFTDGRPINGVVFYLENNVNATFNGNGNQFLAAPNPCPGTDAAPYTLDSDSVRFNIQDLPSGSATALYDYNQISSTYGLTKPLPLTDSNMQQSPANQIYPSMDMQYRGECTQVSTAPDTAVWAKEFNSTSTASQHLQFLFWTRATAAKISLNGSSQQFFYGSIYSPGATGCASACTVTINGGGGGGGVPFLVGQVVADNASFSGSSAYEIFYRPCHADRDPCGKLAGVSLVQ